MAEARAKILVVEDEPAQRAILKYNLEAAGHDVLLAETGDEGLAAAKSKAPDLILLDWMLPGISGIEICRRLKASAKTAAIPVIMISARTEEGDRVAGLDTGADDYVVKPYSISELQARVRSQLRRAGPATRKGILKAKGVAVDLATHRTRHEGREVKLGPTEYRLLVTLIEEPGRVWSRDDLLEKVWGRDIHVEERTVDVHIRRLRQALTQEGETDPIRTVRGAGYALG